MRNQKTSTKLRLPSQTELEILRVMQENRIIPGSRAHDVVQHGFKPGSVYPLLVRMEKKGFLESVMEHSGSAGTHAGKPYRFYRTTNRGKAVAMAYDALLRATEIED